MRGQAHAPKMPETMTVIETRAMAVVDMCNSVLANSTAVPLTVAMASLSKNQEMRKRTICFSCTAILIVFQRDFQAKKMYESHARPNILPFPLREAGSGGPGRCRNHSAAGNVKRAHHIPTTKRIIRMGIVLDWTWSAFEQIRRIPIDRI